MQIDPRFQSDKEVVKTSEQKETIRSSFNDELKELNRERSIIERQLKMHEMIFNDD